MSCNETRQTFQRWQSIPRRWYTHTNRLHQISSPLIGVLIAILMGSLFPIGRILPLVITQLNSSPSHWLLDQSIIHSQENSQAGKRLVAIATYTDSWMVSHYNFIIRTGAILTTLINVTSCSYNNSTCCDDCRWQSRFCLWTLVYLQMFQAVC